MVAISPEAAVAAIRSRLPHFPTESLPLDLTLGATLRENVYAERDLPPFDRVCMDGIAVSSAALDSGLRQFHLQGMQAAGAPALQLAGPGNAIEIMTGAILPGGCDYVIAIEQCQLRDDRVTVTEEAIGRPAFHNVQRRGDDGQKGALLLESGALLGPNEIAVAASCGMARLRVSVRPRVMVVSTGDELVDPGQPIAGYQVRRSNSYAVVAALRARRFTHVESDHIIDDEAVLRERLTLHLSTHDLVILSGGVSMGKFDLVPRALKHLGVEEVFHRVSQRPGKPMWFGIGPQNQLVFGLPGNPVSTMICLVRYVLPAVNEAMGASAPARPELIALASEVVFKLPLTYLLPVAVVGDAAGRSWAEPKKTNGSGDFLSLVGSDGFVELPPGPRTYPRAFVAELHRW